MDLEQKSQILEFKAVEEKGNLYIEAYALTFNVEDAYKDIILPGASIKTISGASGKRIKFCLQHDIEDVIGKIEELKEDGTGLWMRAKISNTTKGKDTAILINDGAINELSIGFRTILSEINETTGIRYLKEIELYEVSLVTRAANPNAKIVSTEVKSEQRDVKDLSDTELLELKSKVQKEYTKRIFKLI